MSTDNPLVQTQKYYGEGKTTAGRVSIQNQIYSGEKIIDQQTAKDIYQKEVMRT